MEQQIEKLAKEFLQKVEQASQQLEQYEKGNTEFGTVLECVHTLNALSGEFQVFIGSEIRSFYNKARRAKERRLLHELGYAEEGGANAGTAAAP
jgi:transcriptional regulator with XRE-family HTH domain